MSPVSSGRLPSRQVATGELCCESLFAKQQCCECDHTDRTEVLESDAGTMRGWRLLDDVLGQRTTDDTREAGDRLTRVA